jgi:hypothetical protein
VLALVAAIVLLPAGTAHASLASVRGADPVVTTGAHVTKLLGQRPGGIVGFRFAEHRWRQVPVQVDERAQVDLGQVYHQGPSGVVVLSYTDPSTFTGPDPDPLLDRDDEIAFMASDTGGHAVRGAKPPRGVNRKSGALVRVRDPLTRQTGYVYLFTASRGSGLRPGAGRSYVSYRFTLKSGSYKDTYRLGAGPNPEDSTISTSFYSRHFSDRWVDDELRIRRGPDILDRAAAQFAPGVCARTEDTFSAGEGAFIVNKSGPVRAIRAYIGANSGPYTEREHIFYSRREDIRTYLRVHAIPGVMDLFDYSPAAEGMWYRNQIATGGVRIDGRPDSLAAGALRWEQVTGKQGTLTISHSLETDVPRLSSSSFQLDQANPHSSSERLCTGDHVAFGASGPWIKQAIPSTDPANGGHNRLQANRILYFDGGAARTAAAVRRDADARHALTVTATKP